MNFYQPEYFLFSQFGIYFHAYVAKKKSLFVGMWIWIFQIDVLFRNKKKSSNFYLFSARLCFFSGPKITKNKKNDTKISEQLLFLKIEFMPNVLGGVRLNMLNFLYFLDKKILVKNLVILKMKIPKQNIFTCFKYKFHQIVLSFLICISCEVSKYDRHAPPWRW